ncbi:MAG: asparaginase domain-containing protein [Clostridiales bacterium]|nr:asparaginase domain-containing protein [Clostridiales bacterium]
MKISVIFTGGTIGSTVEEKYISLDADSYRLLHMYRENYDTSGLQFETGSPFSILSENLSLEHALQLARIVKNQAEKTYDAIILTHGTDTIQYTASLLEWMCTDVKIPVFLVSSNLVLDDPDSNGLINFHGAVVAAGENIAPGVYVSYQNVGGELCIHRASMLLPHRIFDENLYSVRDKIYAVVKNERLIPMIHDFHELRVLDGLEMTCERRIPKIAMLTIYPDMGDVFANTVLSEETDAVILTCYHSGTLPTEQESFLRFCETAKRKNIPVYLCGIYQEHGYSSTKKFEELSLIRMPWISPIALYTKLVSLCVSDFGKS